MAQIKAVPDTGIDPKLGTKRRMSTVAFPYYGLAESIAVAKVIYDNGGQCDRSQLASLLNYKSVNNGSFLTRVTAAKMFGLIDQDGNQLRATERGRRIVAPIEVTDVARSKIEAFMAVELFRKVFDEFDGRPLPPEVGLRNLLETSGVVKDRIVPTVRIMLDSASEAGLFDVAGNRSRMVMPLGIAPTTAAKSPPPPPSPVPSADHGPHRHVGGNGNGGGNGNSSGLDGVHPAIAGLLADLPPAGATLSPKKRAALIAAFTATVGWVYPDNDSED